MARSPSTWLLVTLATGSGCGRLGFSAILETADGPRPPDAAPNTDPCALDQPFGAPVLITELMGPGVDATLRLRPDELSGVFWSDRSGNIDLYGVRRSRRDLPFEVVSLDNVNSPSGEFDPTISADGTNLVFASNRAGGPGAMDLYTSAFDGMTYSVPTLLDTLSSPGNDQNAYLTASSMEILLGSDRDGNGFRLYRATQQNAQLYSTPTLIAEIPTSDSADPVLTADGLTLYWRATGDIYTATRSDTTALFNDTALVPSLNSADIDGPSWISPDTCRIYLSSARSGSPHIYVASRPPV